jgi:hypothetical protein
MGDGLLWMSRGRELKESKETKETKEGKEFF